MKKIIIIIITLFVFSACSSRESSDMVASAPQSTSSSGGSTGRYNLYMEEEGIDQGSWDYWDEPEVAYQYDINTSAPSVPMPAESPAVPMPGSMGQASSGGSQSGESMPRRIIQRGTLDMRTERFDETVDAIRGVAVDSGGFVENANMYTQVDRRNIQSRFISFTLRVPVERFDEIMRFIETFATVVSSSTSAEDVSMQYFDIYSRLETKLIEEERVLDMISRAEEIYDLLSLEERLGQIRTTIEIYNSQLSSIDRQAAYSTIYINLMEVAREELAIVPDNLGSRISQSFVSSFNGVVLFFQNAILFIAGIIMQILVIGLLGLIGYSVSKKIIKRQKQE